jgi:hypothetical protein
MISTYVRNQQKKKVGFLCAERKEDEISFGWAFWHPKKDVYNKIRMKTIALGRMDRYSIPIDELNDYLNGSPYGRVYLDFDASIFSPVFTYLGGNEIPQKYRREFLEFLHRALTYYTKHLKPKEEICNSK